MRQKNLRYKTWGSVLLSFSMATEIIVPVYLYTLKSGDPFTDEKKEVPKVKALTITSCVAGAGIITGVCLIARYRSHKKQYDPGFCLANELYLQDCGLGISLTKKF